MKVLILNSGTGSRMNNTADCKCLVEVASGVTILDAQMEALLNCGLSDFYMTTGHNSDILEKYFKQKYPQVKITFIHNPLFAQTNYIYSIHLARNFLLGSDLLLLHGDLVFEHNVLRDVLAAENSVMTIDTTKPLPEKDFKAVLTDSRICKISVDTFEGSVYAQPLYKLLKHDWELWLGEIEKFCNNGTTNVYAENAFNEISGSIPLFPLDITGRLCFEIDNPEDLSFGIDAFSKMPERHQTVYSGKDCRFWVSKILSDINVQKPFIVCDKSLQSAADMFDSNAVFFGDFTPNPKASDIMSGISLFEKEGCDLLISIGGGSAIDVAKCISTLDMNGDNISRPPALSDTPPALRRSPRSLHLCIPTTAGTGSESTSFAVLYINGEKFSIEQTAHKNIEQHAGQRNSQSSLLPDYVILDPSFLSSLPEYHKKSALLDALCQSIESQWAKGSTAASRSFAAGAINIIDKNIDAYLTGNSASERRMLNAANLSGMAIKISKTTAAHAMSYKLTDLFGIAHGHAVALCLRHVWANLPEAKNLTTMSYNRFIEILDSLNMTFNANYPSDMHDEYINKLVSSVNAERLGNHPFELTKENLTEMYAKILEQR